ncbi:TPA: hypothetical protein ACY3HR_002320 [Citrobacter freundii]
MQQNNQLTNDRLAHVYRNLKRWAEHDNALNSYISVQKIDPIFHDCVVALAELQERRKADSAEPVISVIYKDGWPEPNSAAPVVGADKLPDGVHEFYAAPPAPTVPDEIDVNNSVLDTHRKWMAEGWNRCRSAMLQAKPANTKGPDHAND